MTWENFSRWTRMIYHLGNNYFWRKTQKPQFLPYLQYLNAGFFLVKKSMHWLGPESKIGLNEKIVKFKETLGNKIITDKHAYFVTDIHPILLLGTPF